MTYSKFCKTLQLYAKPTEKFIKTLEQLPAAPHAALRGTTDIRFVQRFVEIQTSKAGFTKIFCNTEV